MQLFISVLCFVGIEEEKSAQWEQRQTHFKAQLIGSANDAA